MQNVIIKIFGNHIYNWWIYYWKFINCHESIWIWFKSNNNDNVVREFRHLLHLYEKFENCLVTDNVTNAIVNIRDVLNIKKLFLQIRLFDSEAEIDDAERGGNLKRQQGLGHTWNSVTLTKRFFWPILYII